ncbi:cyclic nucleotide-binding domain-containing protein [Alphaproteobacteria bacterium GH1-50]|uniref:Cyclic nucleotide-binding domain-containing protein n=1 Tax=Kangsaoukella pontilimi TaxID=2691042 RepID=A0A7C9MSE8_9RHOB|nr:cyclic nucleotide-binding domain-containing protein [Kangsaoukella pontilimi]MXQ09197.1 cyclic nucleotide-binding domain-containing protein [Kangsaoukella pontilimi]
MELDFGLTAGHLAYLGFLLQFFAYLARDELRLRLLMLSGSAAFLLYHYLHSGAAISEIFLSTAGLALTNLFMISIVVMERTTLGMSERDKALFARFDMLTPGQFRRLLKRGTVRKAGTETVLMQDGAASERLFFIHEGRVRIVKSGQETPASAGIFIGEVAFLTSKPATATVMAEPGTEYLEWDSAVLRKLMKKRPKFRVALSAQFNSDLVRKVASSLPNPGL